MAEYRISNVAKADLIRIHQYGSLQFGTDQADKYFNDFFDSDCRSVSHRPWGSPA